MAGMRLRVTSDGSLYRGDQGERLIKPGRTYLQGVLRYGRDEWKKGVHSDTGALKRGIRYRTVVRAHRIGGEIYSDAPEVLQHIDEEGKDPGFAVHKTYAPNARNRKLGRVGKSYIAYYTGMAPPGVIRKSGWLGRHGFEDKDEFVVNRSQAEAGREGTHAADKAAGKIEGLVRSQEQSLGLQLARELDS